MVENLALEKCVIIVGDLIQEWKVLGLNPGLGMGVQSLFKVTRDDLIKHINEQILIVAWKI